MPVWDGTSDVQERRPEQIADKVKLDHLVGNAEPGAVMSSERYLLVVML